VLEEEDEKEEILVVTHLGDQILEGRLSRGQYLRSLFS
jgi:hypothetical protein